MKKIIAERLKSFRFHLEYSQHKLAKLLDLSQQTYFKYESGLAHIPDELKYKLYEKYRLNPLWLLTGTGDMILPTEIKTTEHLNNTIEKLKNENEKLKAQCLELFQENHKLKKNKD